MINKKEIIISFGLSGLIFILFFFIFNTVLFPYNLLYFTTYMSGFIGLIVGIIYGKNNCSNKKLLLLLAFIMPTITTLLAPIILTIFNLGISLLTVTIGVLISMMVNKINPKIYHS